MENKNEDQNKNNELLSSQKNKEEQAKIVKFGLISLWVLALIFGLGFKLWFLFFIALFLTIAYLSGGNIRGFDNSNHRKIGPDLVNDPAYKSISGNVWNDRRSHH